MHRLYKNFSDFPPIKKRRHSSLNYAVSADFTGSPGDDFFDDTNATVIIKTIAIG